MKTIFCHVNATFISQLTYQGDKKHYKTVIYIFTLGTLTPTYSKSISKINNHQKCNSWNLIGEMMANKLFTKIWPKNNLQNLCKPLNEELVYLKIHQDVKIFLKMKCNCGQSWN